MRNHNSYLKAHPYSAAGAFFQKKKSRNCENMKTQKIVKIIFTSSSILCRLRFFSKQKQSPKLWKYIKQSKKIRKTYLEAHLYSAAAAFFPKNKCHPIVKNIKTVKNMKIIFKSSSILCRWRFFSKNKCSGNHGNMKILKTTRKS